MRDIPLKNVSFHKWKGVIEHLRKIVIKIRDHKNETDEMCSKVEEKRT